MTKLSIWLTIFVFLCSCSSEPREPRPFVPGELQGIVDTVRGEYGLPGLGVLVRGSDQVSTLVVAGVRREGEDNLIRTSDMWFIGSAAKSMTASLLASFVESGETTFETTLGELFPELATQFDQTASQVSLGQLLNHTSGLKPNPVESAEEFANLMGDIEDPVLQRQKILLEMITQAPMFVPGADFSYSNTGYIIVGAVIERLGGNSYEELLRERVLAPLGITQFGFGQPADHNPDQPWGHRPTDNGLMPIAPNDQDHVNPRLFDPAGNLFISLNDWSLYAQDVLRGRKGNGALFDQVIYERLELTTRGESGYAMGWGVLAENGVPLMLTHNGSDGNWFADIRIYTARDQILLVVTNDGREQDEARAAFKEIRRQFNERYLPFP